MRVRFGNCELDTDAYELTRAERSVQLTRKAFDLLALLIEARPRVVTRAQLHDRLWPRTFVGRTSLSRLVNEVRNAIGDAHGERRMLRTVLGVGYAFCGDAVELGPRGSGGRSRWSLFWNGREISLREGDNAIGRDLDATVQICGSGVSRRHARLVVDGASVRLEDLGSKNGTLLKGEPIAGAVELVEGDEIGIGPASLVFRVASAAVSTTTYRVDVASGRGRAGLHLAAARATRGPRS